MPFGTDCDSRKGSGRNRGLDYRQNVEHVSAARGITNGKAYRTHQVEYYNLDVIISVGYRVKSQRGVEFRRWATDVLRRYIVEGRAENEKRLIDGLSSCSCP